MGSELHVWECLTLEMIFLPIKFRVTAERQILFSDVNESHGSSGIKGHTMVIVSPLRRSVPNFVCVIICPIQGVL